MSLVQQKPDLIAHIAVVVFPANFCLFECFVAHKLKGRRLEERSKRPWTWSVSTQLILVYMYEELCATECLVHVSLFLGGILKLKSKNFCQYFPLSYFRDCKGTRNPCSCLYTGVCGSHHSRQFIGHSQETTWGRAQGGSDPFIQQDLLWGFESSSSESRR